jgi:hypothetical protein
MFDGSASLYQEIRVTVSQKAALGLLISVFLFAGFAVLAYTGLFDLVESRFYNPSITRRLEYDIVQDSKTIQEFLEELQARFEETLREPAIRRSVLPNQSAEDIFERTRIYGTLLESLGGLQSVRFIDSGGQRIHFSTLSRDILNQDRLSVAYRNYHEDSGAPPYEQVAVSAEEKIKYTLDEEGDRIFLSLPFFDTFEVYRGTALFSVSVRAVAERLVSRNRINAGDGVSIVSSPPGIVSGLPGTSKGSILARIAEAWNDGLLGLTPLESAASETTLILISAKTAQGIFAGRLVNENLFVFPQPMRVILLVSIFLTIYLAIFLFFNLRQDTVTVIQNRLKNLQLSLLEQYYEHKGDMDWTHWTRELEQRREDIRAEVKRGVRLGEGRRSEEDIDTLIDKSWDELLNAMNSQRKSADIDEEKLQGILNRILQAVPAIRAAPGAPEFSAAPALPAGEKATAAGEAEEPEPLEELEEAEAVEDLEPLEEAADAVEVLEPLEEAVEAVEVLESLEEAAEAVEVVEQLEEAAEAVEELEALEEENLEAVVAATLDAFSGEEVSPDAGAVPYIETGDLNLADEDIDSVIRAAHPDEEPAELEELEELEEIEDGAEAGEPEKPAEDIGALASLIEFGSGPEPDAFEQEYPALNQDIEIVSPMSSILSNISISDEEEPENNAALSAEEEHVSFPDDSGADPKDEKKKLTP